MIRYFLPNEEWERLLASGQTSVLVNGFDRVLLAEARRGAVRSRRAAKRRRSDLEAGGAASAILCATAACEAWVSEFIAFDEALGVADLPELVQLRGEKDGTRQWAGLLRLRCSEFDSGSSKEFQRLSCLFRLRDHIAHRAARLQPLDTWPRKLADCVRQHAIPIREARGVDWTSVTLVHEVAKWAVATAEHWLRIAEAHLDEERHKTVLCLRLEDLEADRRADGEA